MKKHEAVIGLEVHAQLLTESKMFCRCRTTFGDPPNTNTCPVCLGMPGTLPTVNEKAIDFAIKAALSFNFEIHPFSQFARKNYFYPDLPKGYQITQYDYPLAEKGHLVIENNGETKRINITRLHIEEDAGKSMHEGGEFSRVDLNRCGVALIEIVSEPEIRSAQEAELYLQKLKQMLVYLGVCDGNMEEGSLRCDANLSIRPAGSQQLFQKTEVKNLNSFRFVRKALEYELARQIEIVDAGGKVQQETLLYDSAANVTRPMRSKEAANDYRYFPEPDLHPLHVDSAWIERIRKTLPELPDEKIKRLEHQYGIPVYDAKVLASERPLADYYEATAAEAGDHKMASNWVMGEVLRVLKEKNLDITEFGLKPSALAALLKLIISGAVSGSAAKEVFDGMVEHPEKSASQVIEEKNLSQVSDEADLRSKALSVIAENPKPYSQYKSGKTKTFGFFVGQIMKATRGRANPKVAQKILRQLLDADELPDE